MNTHTGYDQAAQRVNEKVGFYTHLAVYVAVNGLLTIINFATAPDVLWFYWPLAG